MHCNASYCGPNYRRRQIQTPTRARGFTLVELMVTLVLAVVLATLALPDMRNTSAKNLVKAQANALYSSIRMARTEAMRANSVVSICPSNLNTGTTANVTNPTCRAGTDWSTGWVVFVDNNFDQWVADSDNIRNLNIPPVGAAFTVTASGFTKPTATGGYIAGRGPSFTPNGSMLGDMGTLTVAATLDNGKKTSIVITVYPSGLIEMGPQVEL